MLTARASGGLALEHSSHNEALRQVAASRAAAANAQVRCGQCETCICTQGTPMPRRCLLNRAAAAAAAGHSGAQVCPHHANETQQWCQAVFFKLWLTHHHVCSTLPFSY